MLPPLIVRLPLRPVRLMAAAPLLLVESTLSSVADDSVPVESASGRPEAEGSVPRLTLFNVSVPIDVPLRWAALATVLPTFKKRTVLLDARSIASPEVGSSSGRAPAVSAAKALLLLAAGVMSDDAAVPWPSTS